jgi:Metallo-peptidase family M12B Reprolysin-like/Secretion system C-terminal sorting domain/Bacterial pre-peptidase C-terminal domain/Fibronectin type III domain
MKKVVNLSLVLTLFAIAGFAQSSKYWTSNSKSLSDIPADKAVARLSYPKVFHLINLDINALRSDLFSVVDSKTIGRSVVISLPNADGGMEEFEMVEASNFEPDLQARFPEIRAFSGRGITDRYATVKLSISPQGIQTMVFRTEKENEFIEPYSVDHTVYSVYRSQREKGKLPWTCTTHDQDMHNGLEKKVNSIMATGGSNGTIKTMRLAQSCNAEYANYFGATSASQVGLVLAAFNATITRCNGVYEKDLALHLNLISNTTSVIYYSPSTDPYSTTLSQWNLQLQQTLTSVIGSANYDIGHMFGQSGGGGNAGCIGCVCVDPATSTSLAKGSGITSPADGIPQGDNFDIDYVVHEVGHQLGGNHTFSMTLEGTGQNKEVGSGITIMGYAGITSQDVAPHSIDIYHETTIAQIQANLATKSCPVSVVMTANTAPVVAPVSNYTIPISTPFALTASATDAENDPITYCWEQNDNSTVSGTSSVASATKASGPNWLSFLPTVSGTRTFPKLSTILSGLNVTPPITGGDAGTNIEALSSVSRTLNFRVTARDNKPYSPGVTIGQTGFTDAVVTVTSTAGPFAVTAPNTAVTWTGGASATVTWSVNGTNAGTVNCANVKVSLSTDGGNTFPIVLLASTPNDGTEAITVPVVASTTCRVKIESIGNIFFDISNANFTISGAVACGDPSGLNATSVTTSSATLNWAAVSGALSYDVSYKLTSSGVWTDLVLGTAATSANLSALAQGTTYDWRVRATCSAGSGNFVASQVTTTTPPTCNAPAGLASSSITTSGATVSWSAAANGTTYDVDYSVAAANSWVNVATGTAATSVTISGLSASTSYDWRVRTHCGGLSLTSGYTTAQFTTAAVVTCPGVYDVSTNGTTAGAATIPFNTNVLGLINVSGDNDYYKFVITTGGTITMTLTTLPANYSLRLLNSAGTTLVSSTNTGTTSESISTTVAAGTYYARVYANTSNFNATSCYTLKVALGTASKGEITDVSNAEDRFIISPNPAQHTANLSFHSEMDGDAEITVSNMVGRIIFTQKASVVEGQNNAVVDLTNLANGIYLVRIQNGDQIKTAKILVSK